MTTVTNLKGTDVTFALHDPATALASLFRPVCRGRRPLGLKVLSNFDGYDLMFTCFEWLDTRDQSILLALVGMAGINGAGLSAAAKGVVGKELWSSLEPEKMAVDGNAVVVTTTYYALLEAAGLPTRGADYARVKDILYRLAQVGCRAKKDGYDWSMRLLSYASDADGLICVALNERFAKALGGQNVRVSLSERREIKSDAAQVLHAWLTATTRAGSKGFWMGVDAIAVKVWGVAAQNASTQRYRRQVLLEAVLEIEGQGWKFEKKGVGARQQIRAQRPKIKRD